MPKKQQSSKRKTIIIAIVIMAVFSIGSFLLIAQRNRQDANRFAEADKNMQAVFNDLVQSVGTPIETETKNVCYNTENGPYDNGRLWCRVSAAAYFAHVAPGSSIKNILETVVDNNNLPSAISDSGDAVFYAAEGVPCSLIVYDGEAAKNPGHRFGKNAESKLTLVVRCADRAKAKHYPYMN